MLAQGTGKTPSKPFGNGGKTSCGGSKLSLKCWDAFHPYHLPLPRSVGPYTVVRTTVNFNSADRVVLISPFKYQHGGSATLSSDDAWTTVCALHSVDSGLSIRAPDNAQPINAPFPGLSPANPGQPSALTATPSAISVQVMNGNALQSTNGMVFGAVCPTELDVRNRIDTWREFGKDIISFMKPRMMSAGKLSLRGVQADAYPLNMNAVSGFSGVIEGTSSAITYTDSSAYKPDGWSPIVIVNMGSTLTPPLDLNYLITIEWRVRFDITNPAVSSHRNHGVTSDNEWDTMIRKASSRAHGMLDIVERVANVGTAIAAVAA